MQAPPRSLVCAWRVCVGQKFGCFEQALTMSMSISLRRRHPSLPESKEKTETRCSEKSRTQYMCRKKNKIRMGISKARSYAAPGGKDAGNGKTGGS